MERLGDVEWFALAWLALFMGGISSVWIFERAFTRWRERCAQRRLYKLMGWKPGAWK